MVVITVASRKGGSGKSTLTANLAAFADKASRRCLLTDADPQGSLSLWHGLRKSGEPPLRTEHRQRRRPPATLVVIPAKRDGAESPLCTQARDSLEVLRAPVWFGQITHRTTYSLALAGGQGAREFDAESQAASEIARLFNSIERSVKAIQGEYKGINVMHRRAA